jgi:hypothetical protein
MIVHVGTKTIDQVPAGKAGAAANQLAADHGIPGNTFTFKADGVVLGQGAKIPDGANVLELIEATADPAPAEPEPVAVEPAT